MGLFAVWKRGQEVRLLPGHACWLVSVNQVASYSLWAFSKYLVPPTFLDEKPFGIWDYFLIGLGF